MKIYNQPQTSFGMAWKFGRGGAERMAMAFKDEPEAAKNIVKSVQALKNVDVVVDWRSVEVKPNRYKELLTPFLQVQEKSCTSARYDKLAKLHGTAEQAKMESQEPFFTAELRAKAIQAEIDSYDKTIAPLVRDLEDLGQNI